MKKKICLLTAFVLCLSFLLCSCKDDNSSSSEVINIVSEESSDVVSDEVVSDEPISQEDVSSTESVNVIYELTDDFKGDWQVVSVYQEAKVSEKDSDVALSDEKTHAIHIDNDFYEGYDFHLTKPSYKIQEVSSSVLIKEYGFSADNVKNDFGEKVKMLTVEDGEGIELGASVYFLKGDNLVRCGNGAHLYLCKRVKAVG